MAELTLNPGAAANLLRDAQARLGAVASRAVELAREKAPVKTGRLRDSIHAERQSDGSWLVQADADYAAAVEFGTHRQRAHLFMTGGLNEAAQQAETLMRDPERGG